MEDIVWYLGIGLSIILVQFKSRHFILVANICFCLLMALSMYMQQAYTGMAINIICALWTVIFLVPWACQFFMCQRRTAFSLGGAVAIISPLMVSSAIDLIALCAFAAGRYAETASCAQRMRYLYLLAQVCWLAYALMNGLELQLVTGAIALTSIVCGIIRYSQNTAFQKMCGVFVIKPRMLFSARRPETTGAASRFFKIFNNVPFHLLILRDHHLCNPHSSLDGKRLGSKIGQNDLYLAAVVSINGSRRI